MAAKIPPQKAKMPRARVAQRWAQRETDQLLKSIGRYTRFVVFSKMFLGIAASALILSVIIVPVVNKQNEGVRLVFSTIKEKNAALPIMKNPHFQGVDEKNQPYNVTATSAIQQSEDVILLNEVKGDMFVKDGTWLGVSAKSGALNMKQKNMQLNGNVTLNHEQGYEFVTDEVRVNIAKQVAEGDKPIHGKSEIGILDAAGFRIEERGKKLYFKGPVRMKMNMSKS